MSDDTMSLATLRAGAVVEQFDEALGRVLENVVDPNTKARAKRTITLKVTLLPDEERELLTIEANVKTSMAPAAPINAKAWVAHTRNGLLAMEHDPKQPNLYDETEDNVQPLQAVGGDE
jgi:hypothetical protein